MNKADYSVQLNTRMHHVLIILRTLTAVGILVKSSKDSEIILATINLLHMRVSALVDYSWAEREEDYSDILQYLNHSDSSGQIWHDMFGLFHQIGIGFSKHHLDYVTSKVPTIRTWEGLDKNLSRIFRRHNWTAIYEDEYSKSKLPGFLPKQISINTGKYL